jgi:hypothetical protein
MSNPTAINHAGGYAVHGQQIFSDQVGKRPSVGDMIAVLDTVHMRNKFSDGIGKKFIVRSGGNDSCHPYKVDGYEGVLYPEDVQVTDHFIKEESKVVVKAKIIYEGRTPLVPGLRGQVLKRDSHGAVIQFNESGVRWDHDVDKQDFALLRRPSMEEPLFEEGEVITVTAAICYEGKSPLVRGLRGTVLKVNDNGALIKFNESGVEWEHWVRKEHFVRLEGALE